MTLVCISATTLPPTIVTAATITSTSWTVPPTSSGGSARESTTARATNVAALEAVDMKAVSAVGAPWYTSGVHMWKGTADTLKKKPTSSRPTPARKRPFRPVSSRPAARPVRSIVPVAP